MLVLVLYCQPLICRADEVTDTVNKNIDETLHEFYDTLPDGFESYGDPSKAGEELGIKRLLSSLILALKGEKSDLADFCLSLLGIALLYALSSLAGGAIGNQVSRAVGIVSSAMLFERLIFLTKGVGEMLAEVNGFISAIIPVTVSVNTIGASPTTASTQALGMGITLAAYSFISSEALTAMACVVFVLAALGGIDPVFEKLSKSVKSVFTFFIGILTALMGATFSLQAVIASSADSGVIRSAKYAISSSVPVVGGALSGALGVVSGGVAYARSVIGGGAVAVILTLALSPIVTLFAYRLCLKIGVFLSDVCALDTGELFSPFLSAIDILIAVASLTSIIYICELIAFLKGGASLA